MRKWLIGLVLALGVVIGTFAQNTAPFALVATLEVDTALSLAVDAGGEHLIVGVGDENQAQVYSLADPLSPGFINAAALDGAPTAMIGAQGFALVTVAAEDGDLLQIVARPPYNPRLGFINYGTYDVIAAPAGIAISPSARWGVIYGENGYTVLEILSVDEINSTTVDGVSVISAAVSDNGLLLLREDSATLEVFTLGRGAQLGRSRQLELSAPGRDVALNIRGTVGAVLLETNSLVLFDPGELSEYGRFDLPAEFDQVDFLTREDGEWLVLSNLDDDSLLLLDVSDPRNASALGSFSLNAPVQALTIHDNLLVTTDGQTVTIFASE
jgi:hypothetical protein